MKKIDLHLHSYFSDGKLSPAELVSEAKKVELEIIALTDHESVAGLPEAIEAGRGVGLKVVPGIEFTAVDPGGREQHLLGLCIDYQNPELKSFLETWEKTKIRQIQAMIKKLQEKGFAIKLEEVAKQAKGSLRRSHVGYAVLEKKENEALLERMGIKTMADFFDNVLSSGRPETIYVERKKPTAKEVIELTKRIGGISVWAHPFWKGQGAVEIERKCRLFKSFGLGGIEVCYNRIFSSIEKASVLHQIARSLGLYETMGSDFHSFRMPKFNKLADFDTFGLELRLPPAVEEM